MELMVCNFNIWEIETRNEKNHKIISDRGSTFGFEKKLENEEYLVSVSHVKDEEHWSYVKNGKVKTEAIDSFEKVESDVNIRMV